MDSLCQGENALPNFARKNNFAPMQRSTPAAEFSPARQPTAR
jgi:hypothetical protein